MPTDTPNTTPHTRVALLVALALASGAAQAQITFYEHPNFEGRSVTTNAPLSALSRSALNDRASSAVVRGQRWEICDGDRFQGRCTVLRPGQYPSLMAMGLDDRVSSVRAVNRRTRDEELRYAPAPWVSSDYRRRDRERLYDATVEDARAVYGEPAQRCWMAREDVTERRDDQRVPSAVLGAVIGGILGHQIGGGSGRSLATAGGVVAGAVVGGNLARNRNGDAVVTRDVQRCANAPGNQAPAYWDVSYRFRGQQHHVQLASQPGATLRVNAAGEPRA
jgi:uncharacterized protein YcfJ